MPHISMIVVMYNSMAADRGYEMIDWEENSEDMSDFDYILLVINVIGIGIMAAFIFTGWISQ